VAARRLLRLRKRANETAKQQACAFAWLFLAFQVSLDRTWKSFPGKKAQSPLGLMDGISRCEYAPILMETLREAIQKFLKDPKVNVPLLAAAVQRAPRPKDMLRRR
jgi:hypothetical protein